jgi:hypothetical protein
MWDIHKFKARSVQDLAWALGSPSLIVSFEGMSAIPSDFFREELVLAWPWLQGLDRNPDKLEEALASPPTSRLGIYFERLLAFWLRHHERYDLIAENLQVREGGITHGAFDFLLRRQDGVAEHWEVAIKFYLKRFEATDWSSWVGPNKEDRLDKKLQRMCGHQLPLSGTPLGIETLRSLGISEPPLQRALVKGMLFNHWREAKVRPVQAAPEQPLGVWLAVGEFEAYADQGEAVGWCLRTKPDWLVPAKVGTQDVLTADDILSQVAEPGFIRPIMLSALGEAGCEQQRLFLVPEGWADTEA